MTIDAAVLIGEGPDSLEGTKVTTPAGTDLFREGVVISDPDSAQGRANVKALGVQLSTADSGLVVNAIIHGETTGAGGGYRDVKVNPSGALVADVTGSSVSVSNFPATQQVSGTVSARDAYTGGEALADQTTSNAVATFTFSSPVQLVYVYGASTLGTNTYRADPFGGTPSNTSGIPSPDGVATAIPVQTSVIRVFGASGIVSVWGFRY